VATVTDLRQCITDALLADRTQSDRAIARAFGCSKSTVAKYRAQLPPVADEDQAAVQSPPIEKPVLCPVNGGNPPGDQRSPESGQQVPPELGGNPPSVRDPGPAYMTGKTTSGGTDVDSGAVPLSQVPQQAQDATPALWTCAVCSWRQRQPGQERCEACAWNPALPYACLP
jgi:hypothetical protein